MQEREGEIHVGREGKNERESKREMEIGKGGREWERGTES